ncbi:hypothetical protein QUA20_09050 [Microcoleus sp. Pol7_A1]
MVRCAVYRHTELVDRPKIGNSRGRHPVRVLAFSSSSAPPTAKTPRFLGGGIFEARSSETA